jgi:putative transposase
VVKEYKEKITKLEREHNQLAKKVGTLTIERDWLAGKLCSLDLSTKKRLASRGDVQAAVKEKTPSLNQRLELMRISKTAWYYRHADPFGKKVDILLLNTINRICTKHPYYGHRRIRKVLNRLGFEIGRKRVIHAMKYMGIKALYPKPKTTIADKEHTKYPYLLSAYKNNEGQVVTSKPNEVWLTDITNIRLEKGYAYLAAVIDWNSKHILSWKLSATMDTELTTSVLNEALAHHPKPKIFNTDQGSQYTAKAHIDILTKHAISVFMDAKGENRQEKANRFAFLGSEPKAICFSMAEGIETLPSNASGGRSNMRMSIRKATRHSRRQERESVNIFAPTMSSGYTLHSITKHRMKSISARQT